MPVHRSRGWPIAVAVLFWTALAPAVALAQQAQQAQQTGDEDARKAEGRAHFERGLELSDDQAWDAAYAEYATSIAAYPTKAATKNAALCLRMMHRYAEALDTLERFLRFSNLTDADRAFAGREMSEMKRFVGLLVVRGPDAGAVVSVDGGDRGRMPLLAPLRLTAGSHVVRVFKPGFAPLERQFVLAGAQTVSVDVRLDPVAQPGRLRVVEQAGKHPQVLVDGAAVGAAPWEGPVGAGDHTAALKGDGVLGTQPVSVPVRLDAVATITLALEPLEGELRVEPTPANAVVAVDGVTLGRGVWEGPVRLGERRVEVASEGFIPSRQTVRLEKGSRRAVAVQLERDPSSPLWRAQHPPHVFLEAGGAALLSPSLGGDIAGACKGACSSGVAAGVMGELRAGYELSSGLGFSIDGGYAWVQQKVTHRTDALQPLPVGSLEPDPGTSNDTLGVQGPIVTASASVHRGSQLTWLARVGIGAWFTTVSDARTGTYTTVLSAHPDHTLGSPAAYSVGPLTESSGTPYGVLVPELRVGWRIGKAEIGAGVRALFALPFSTPRWQSSQQQVLTGNCGATPTPTCVSDGLAVYGTSVLTGSVVVLIAPGISVTYSL
jgi:hypothetical protein